MTMQCAEYTPRHLNPGGQRYRCMFAAGHAGTHENTAGDRWDDRGRVMPVAGLAPMTDEVCSESCCDEIDDAAALFELQNDRRYAPTDPGLEDRKRAEVLGNERKALYIRLRDWIHDVHECGPVEYQTDDELADSLILFVEQEVARALDTGRLTSPRCGEPSDMGLTCNREPEHPGLHKRKHDGHLHSWGPVIP